MYIYLKIKPRLEWSWRSLRFRSYFFKKHLIIEEGVQMYSDIKFNLKSH